MAPEWNLRIDEVIVAGVLRCIGTLPDKRDRPLSDDMSGPYDFWFDESSAYGRWSVT